MKIRLESERLNLVSLDSGDSKQFYDFLLRNSEYFKKWSPEYEIDYFSLKYHRSWLKKIERDNKIVRQIKFCLYLKSDPNKIIGTVSFSNIIGGIFLSCFLGYRIDEQQTIKGFATEAIKRGVQYMFE